MIKQCKQCDTINPQHNDYCVECGSKLPKAKAMESRHHSISGNKPQPKSSFFTAGCGLIIFVILIIIFVPLIIASIHNSNNAAITGIRVQAPDAAATTARSLSPSTAPAVAPATAAGAPAKGLALFRLNGCVMCHLNEGRTAGPVCPQLKGTTRDDTYIRNQIALGRNAMPSFPSVTEDQKTDIIAYIRYLSGPTGDTLPPGASPAG